LNNTPISRTTRARRRSKAAFQRTQGSETPAGVKGFKLGAAGQIQRMRRTINQMLDHGAGNALTAHRRLNGNGSQFDDSGPCGFS